MPDSATLNLAYNAIIAALSHGVVIKQQDLTVKVKMLY
jgi:hypothetical protein